jgi:hypothetical protein
MRERENARASVERAAIERGREREEAARDKENDVGHWTR